MKANIMKLVILAAALSMFANIAHAEQNPLLNTFNEIKNQRELAECNQQFWKMRENVLGYLATNKAKALTAGSSNLTNMHDFTTAAATASAPRMVVYYEMDMPTTAMVKPAVVRGTCIFSFPVTYTAQAESEGWSSADEFHNVAVTETLEWPLVPMGNPFNPWIDSVNQRSKAVIAKYVEEFQYKSAKANEYNLNLPTDIKHDVNAVMCSERMNTWKKDWNKSIFDQINDIPRNRSRNIRVINVKNTTGIIGQLMENYAKDARYSNLSEEQKYLLVEDYLNTPHKDIKDKMEVCIHLVLTTDGLHFYRSEKVQDDKKASRLVVTFIGRAR